MPDLASDTAGQIRRITGQDRHYPGLSWAAISRPSGGVPDRRSCPLQTKACANRRRPRPSDGCQAAIYTSPYLALPLTVERPTTRRPGNSTRRDNRAYRARSTTPARAKARFMEASSIQGTYASVAVPPEWRRARIRPA